MRLFAKIFICVTSVLSIALLFSGYLLITYSYEHAINREVKQALDQYQYNKFSVQAALITNTGVFRIQTVPDHITLIRISSDLSGQIAFFSEDKSLLFSKISIQPDLSILDAVSDHTNVHAFQKADGINYLLVCGKIVQDDISLYLLVATDISPVNAERDLMIHSFETVYFVTLGFSMILILILSTLLTRPIKNLTKAANRIARGQYHERLRTSGNDEISALSGNFNRMADAVEDKINELSENVRQKEDFVASFAHELKTPLTSVIGYADMLYQKSLSPEQTKNAAGYILSEGLRLEALARKLMDLIVLNRQDFILEELSAEAVLQDIVYSLTPLLKEKKVLAHLDMEAGYIRVEYDLFKTLLLNLIDNAVKAECNKIWIFGKQKDNCYRIEVSDNGRGIPESELGRITEAFYMVDKSRSRKQHGAGLGLALAAKIAEIHNSRLRFYNRQTGGTTVEIDLPNMEHVYDGGTTNA